MNNLTHIITQFTIEGRVVSIEPFGSGHINDSYLVTTVPASATDYVLQRVNHDIFRNVEALTGNILKVTDHLAKRLLANPSGYDNFQVIRLIRTVAGNYFTRDNDGNYWRLFGHVRGSQSYDRVLNTALASEGGRAFALFQYLASDLDALSLHEIIPDFHNIATRLATFNDTIARDPAGRANEVAGEINFIQTRADEMHAILRLGEQGLIPVRVTHNDTKFNNILFNSFNKAISVVDLDTVMPGYILYDFGDAIRTGASTAAEDEADLSKMHIDLSLFEAYAKGYLGIARNFLNTHEINHLAFSAKFMTYIIGLRFLTDHIDGDHYFKTAFPGHNLRRARAQFKLLESMEHHFGKMVDIIRKIN